MDDIHKNTEEYNLDKNNKKILIVHDDKIADMPSNIKT